MSEFDKLPPDPFKGVINIFKGNPNCAPEMAGHIVKSVACTMDMEVDVLPTESAEDREVIRSLTNVDVTNEDGSTVVFLSPYATSSNGQVDFGLTAARVMRLFETSEELTNRIN